MLTLKACNGRCVMEWLAERVYEAYLNPQYVAFDPVRFCLIAGAMCLGGTLIALGFSICSQVVGQERSRHGILFLVQVCGEAVYVPSIRSALIGQYWAHIHAIGISRG